MSDPVTAVITKADSFFLILPTYDQSLPFNTPEERKIAASGAVVMGFRKAKLFNSAFELFFKQNPNLVIKVYDGQTADVSKLLYDSNRDKQVLGTTNRTEIISELRTVESAGRYWTIESTLHDAIFFPPVNFTTVVVMNSFLLLIAGAGATLTVARLRYTKDH
jgi:hypothetical protein